MYILMDDRGHESSKINIFYVSSAHIKSAQDFKDCISIQFTEKG